MGTLHRLTCTWIVMGAVAVVGCGKKGETAGMETTAAAATTAGATTAPAATPATPAAAPVNLADVAGKWNLTATPDSGRDTTPTHAVIDAKASSAGWTITFPGRAALPARVSTGGDSIVMDVGPYPSVRRKGVQVTTHSVMRVQAGDMVGTTVSHYAVKTADSVMTMHIRAARAK